MLVEVLKAYYVHFCLDNTGNVFMLVFKEVSLRKAVCLLMSGRDHCL